MHIKVSKKHVIAYNIVLQSSKHEETTFPYAFILCLSLISLSEIVKQYCQSEGLGKEI